MGFARGPLVGGIRGKTVTAVLTAASRCRRNACTPPQPTYGDARPSADTYGSARPAAEDLGRDACVRPSVRPCIILLYYVRARRSVTDETVWECCRDRFCCFFFPFLSTPKLMATDIDVVALEPYTVRLASPATRRNALVRVRVHDTPQRVFSLSVSLCLSRP